MRHSHIARMKTLRHRRKCLLIGLARSMFGDLTIICLASLSLSSTDRCRNGRWFEEHWQELVFHGSKHRMGGLMCQASRHPISSQDIDANFDAPGLQLTCQYVKFREIQDMKRRSKHFGGVEGFTSIAEIFTRKVAMMLFLQK